MLYLTTPEIPDLVGMRDKDPIIFCLSRKVHLRTTQMFGSTIYFFFKLEDIEETIALWESNEPIPVEDIRDFFTAYALWNSIVHNWRENAQISLSSNRK